MPCLFLISDSCFLSPIASLASTPEEMREEKKEQEGDRGGSSEESRAAKAKASKPLMPTSTILRLLAELVRSYVGIATLIATYNYTAGQSELIKEVGGQRQSCMNKCLLFIFILLTCNSDVFILNPFSREDEIESYLK